MVTQKTRPIGVKTPLGEDVLLLRSMSGTEHMGRLFQYELSALSTDEAVPIDDILGQNITVRLDLPDDTQRYFNGFVTRFAQTGRSTVYASYQISVRPWLWFLTRRQDCRIFQEMTVPDIIKKVFRDDGFSDFEASLSGAYPKRTYCVQYRETDFDFVSRLMEEEGIYYYFKHEDGKHTLVLSDSYGSHALVPLNGSIPYYPSSENVVHEEDHIHDWSITREVVPGLYTLQDWDFEKPSVDLTTRSKVQRPYALASFEIYDHPGRYLLEADGKNYTKARIEELQWQHEQVHGAGRAHDFTAGGLFAMTGYPRDDQNREYLIVSASYDLRTLEFESGARDDSGPQYACRFSAIESKTPYRTPRFTPRPVIQGPQTAMVVGPAGDEIYTDKYGRVKVQFHWDRQGKKDENSSCWIRVAQVWAGKAWGGIQIPRIGQEVMVEFLEGDPDRPIITGRVYNADQMPPYDLPHEMTKSGIKSRSTKGGAGGNFNEFRFEDKKGSEEVFLQAEKDYNQIVENDRTEEIGRDRALHVKHDKTETVDNVKTITVGVDHQEKIGSNMVINIGSTLTEMIGVNYSETVGAAMELTIGAAMAETVGGVKAQTIGGSKTESIGGNKTVTVGKDQTDQVDGKHEQTIGKDKKVTIAGEYSISVQKDKAEAVDGKSTDTITKEYVLEAKKVTVEAQDEVILKTGSASISMKKNGDIVIDGKKITVKGSGDLVLKGSKITEN